VTATKKTLQDAAVQPCAVEVNVWQTLIFAVIFIIGLIRIIEWLIEKLGSAIVGQTRSMSSVDSQQSESTTRRRPRNYE